MKTLRQFLRRWHLQVLSHQAPCHASSFKVIFAKHASVMDILCNHGQAATDWATGLSPVCCCKTWTPFKKACLNPGAEHWILAGNLLGDLLPPEQAVIAEGSLLNKVFPNKKERLTMMSRALYLNIASLYPTTSPHRQSLLFFYVVRRCGVSL